MENWQFDFTFTFRPNSTTSAASEDASTAAKYLYSDTGKKMQYAGVGHILPGLIYSVKQVKPFAVDHTRSAVLCRVAQ